MYEGATHPYGTVDDDAMQLWDDVWTSTAKRADLSADVYGL